MRQTLKTLIISLFLLLPVMLSAQTDQQQLYRIYFENYENIRNLESTGINIFDHKPGSYIDILATPSQAENLKKEGFRVEFLAESFVGLTHDRRMKASPEYHNYAETIAELNRIAGAYPDITMLSKIGESVLGRDLACLKISDHPQDDEDEIPILIVGAHHGNEVLSVEATLFMIQYLVEHYPDNEEVASWVNDYEIWFVPLVNPDGREAVRRTNENGVDLNRNYSFQHTAVGNHGTPFSEPETQAIRDLVSDFPPALSLTYHTSGRYVLFPWTHAFERAPDSTAFLYQGQILAESLVFPEGSGTAHYTLQQGGRWYFTAGEYCDYLYATYGTMAYTIEMWTRQNPDGSVIPEVVNRNLEGFKTLMRQARKAGVTGRITDRVSGEPLVAEIRIRDMDDQNKLEPRFSDEMYGRYTRYLAPGDYQLLICTEGYRDVYQDITIGSDQLTVLDVAMESGPHLRIQDIQLVDGGTPQTEGNQDGQLNLAEIAGIRIELINDHALEADSVFVRVLPDHPLVTMLQDSAWVGALNGYETQQAADLILFTISPDCRDGEELPFKVEIFDSEGIGWAESLRVEVYAPDLVLNRVMVMDEHLNNNQILEPGERAEVGILMSNEGRQTIFTVPFTLTTGNDQYTIVKEIETLRSVPAGQSNVLIAELELAADADPVTLGEFNLNIRSGEGYETDLTFRLPGFTGLFDDFESAGTSWTFASYGTTANHHCDWQLGEPQGLSGDPDQAFSGNRCWGTDLGYASWQGESWNGAYQNQVHNYLRSPVMDCSEMTGVGIRYQRWLTTRMNDIGRILVNDTVVWESARRGHADHDWVTHEIDISEIADGREAVWITFELESDATHYAGGWNIDDVILANGMFASSAIHTSEQTVSLEFSGYPNPFSNEGTTFGFALKESSPVQLRIMDLNGRTVCRIRDSRMQAGHRELFWNGMDQAGHPVSAGVYLVVLQTADQTARLRLLKTE